MRAMIIGLFLGITVAVFEPIFIGPSVPLAFAQVQEPSYGEGPGAVANDLPKTGTGPMEMDQPWALYISSGAIALFAIMLGFRQLRKGEGLATTSSGVAHKRRSSDVKLA